MAGVERRRALQWVTDWIAGSPTGCGRPIGVGDSQERWLRLDAGAAYTQPNDVTLTSRVTNENMTSSYLAMLSCVYRADRTAHTHPTLFLQINRQAGRRAGGRGISISLPPA